MLFMQFANSNSLSEISNGLRLSGDNLNHLGITKKVPLKSSLSYINIHRDWHLFHEYFNVVLKEIQLECGFGKKKFKIKLKKKYMH